MAEKIEEIQAQAKKTLNELAKAKKELKEVKETAEKFQKEVRSQIATAITAAFAFTVALVWKDAITAGIDNFLQSIGITGTSYFYKILSAIIVTAIAVVGIWYFSKWSQKEVKLGTTTVTEAEALKKP